MSTKKVCILLMMFFILSSLDVFGLSQGLENDLKDSVVLYVNSNMAYVNNKDTYIDSDNKEVKTMVSNGRTLIPLRFVSENLGAKVSYEASTKTATINVKNIDVKFTANVNSMQIAGKKVPMDVAAQIINGRMFVPLRALTENALNKDIFYNKGLIVIGNSVNNLDSQKIDQLMTKFSDPFEYQLKKPANGDIVAYLKTDYGTVKMKLFYEDAPLAVENFVKLSQKGYYNGVTFHRIIKDFMIQGGDPTGTGMGGESIWGKQFKDEISKRLYNLKGALCMANSGPNTNGSQFYIVQNASITEETKEFCLNSGVDKDLLDKYSKIGGAPWLDGSYTVFGQVYEGMEVVDKIAAVKVGENDKPLKDVNILEVKTFKVGQENQPVVFAKSAYTPE